MLSLSQLAPFGKKTRWRTTFVDSLSGHLFCNLAEPSIDINYERIEDSIQMLDKCQQLKKLVFQPAIGIFCLSKSFDSSVLHRSQITHVDNDEKYVEVYFLDVGSSNVIPFENLFEMPSEFLDLSPHANECILADVEPAFKNDRWSERAIELIKELVLDQELVGVAVRLQRNILVLRLYANQDATVTVGEQLIAAGFGQPKCPSSTSGSKISFKRSNSSSSVSSVSSKKSSSSSSKVKVRTNQKFKKVSNLSVEDYIDLCVVKVLDLNEFYCQLITSRESLLSLQDTLQKAYSNTNVVTTKLSLFSGNPCCIWFSDDDLWYRGVIKSVKSDSCSVFFIDNGNTVNISKQHIYELLPNFFSLPAMAVKCSLAGVEPLSHETKFSDRCCRMFQKCVKDTDNTVVGLVSEVADDTIKIILYNNQDNSINQKLIDEKLVSASIPNNMHYVSQNIEFGSEELVYITYSYHPHNFYVNLNSFSENLSKLMANLQDVYKGNDLNCLQCQPAVGFPCVAPFSEDGDYYRAEIIGTSETEVEVLFVDYGNSETKPFNELKPLRKEFIKLPKQAIKCRLDKVEALKDNRFDDPACVKFEMLTIDKGLMMTVMEKENGHFTVKLVEVDINNQILAIDISKELILSGLVKERKEKTIKDYGPKITSPDSQYNELQINVNSFVDVAPVDVINPSQFCCHLVPGAAEFKRLTAEINEFYQSAKHDCKVSWKTSMPCVALYDIDGCWYRAIITNVLDQNKVEVTFVDFGNSATVPETNLFLINKEFFKMPSQIFVCSLADVAPVDKCWSMKAAEDFRDIVLDKHLAGYVKAKAKSNSYSIMLYDTKCSPEINIGQWLVQRNHAMSNVLSSHGLGCEEYVSPNATELVYITDVVSAKEVYVQLTRYNTQLVKLINDLHTFYSQLAPEDLCVSTPIIGQYCCVNLNQDVWTRAIIDEVDGDNIKIKCIDYGNSEILTLKAVKVLNQEFFCPPKFAVQCQLLDMADVDMPIQTLKLKIFNKEFQAEFELCSMPFGIRLCGSDAEVLSSPSKSFESGISVPKVCFREKEEMEMYFLQALSPHDFYCQPTVTENELNSLMEKISSYIAKEKKVLKKVYVGSYCLVYFEDDGGWYRAKVEKIKDEEIHVFFCDYGNQSVVNSNSVAVLPPEFASLHQQAVQCSLFGIQSAGDDWSIESQEFINNICSEKTLKVRVICKDSNDKYIVEIDELARNLVRSGFAGAIVQQCDDNQSSNNFKCYLNPELKVGQRLSVICTLVNSVTNLEIQLKDSLCSVNKIMEGIEQEFQELYNRKQIKDIKIGMPCVAQFAEDECWYRAVVENILGENVTVRYVDFGNNCLLKKSDICEINKKYLDTPIACVTCILKNVDGANLDFEEALKFLNSQVNNQFDFKISDILRKNTLVGSLITKNETSINSILCDTFKTKNTVIKRIGYFVPEVNKLYESTCFAIQSPNVISCQLAQFQVDLEELMNKIASVAETAPVATNLSVGELCIAKYKEDESWYRGKIVCVGEEIVVEFIDYGNQDAVSPTDIRVMSEEFVVVPQACVTVNLADVHLTDINCNATKSWLEENFLEAEMRLEIVKVEMEASVTAYVYEGSNSEHINDKIYELFGLEDEYVIVESSETADTVVVKVDLPKENSQLEVSVLAAEEKRSKSTQLSYPDLTAGEMYECTCFIVDSPVQLKCQLSQFQEDLEELMNKIASVAESAPVATNLFVGELCIAKYKEDESWYRGKIVCVGEEIVVEFIDYGNQDAVLPTDIRVMSEEFVVVPQACVTVNLADVHLTDINCNATKSWLEENLLEAEMRLKIVKVEMKTSVTAYVYEGSNSKHINNKIYELFGLEDEDVIVESSETADTVVAKVDLPKENSQLEVSVPAAEKKRSKSTQLSYPDLTAGEMYECTCFIVDSPVQLKCQLSQFQEDLEELMNKIASVAESAPVATNLFVGELCIAKYKEDESWYRGKIVCVGEEIVVEFIDYGNQDAVLPTDIRVMSEEFVVVPQACVTVNLADVHLTDINCNATKSWLEENLLEAEMRLKIVKVEMKTSVTAYVYEGSNSEHINDKIYELFGLEDEDVIVESSETADTVVAKVDLPKENSQLEVSVPAAEEKRSKSTQLSYPDLTAGEMYECTCFIVDSPVQLKCQLAQFQEDLEELMNKIASVAESAPVATNLSVGELCIAKYKEDECWYRGEIVCIGEEIVVEFIDYGNQDAVSSTDIRVMSEEFVVVPQACVTVNLADVHLTDINCNATKSWLEENLLEAEMRLKIVKVEMKTSVTAYVYEGSNSKHINNKIYELFGLEDEDVIVESSETADTVVAKVDLPKENSQLEVSVPAAEKKRSKSTQLSYPDLTAGEMYECTCFIVDSPVQLKCQLAQFQEDLEELMNKIASVAESAPVATNLSVGELCIAKYKEDESWYRGKIVCIGEEIVVEFIDYGNQDAVLPTDILVMSEEFVVVPQACVTVNLADVHLTDINCNATKSWLEENFLETEMRLKIVKVEMKTSVTAYVYEGSNSEHINDKIYELFGLEDEDVIVESSETADTVVAKVDLPKENSQLEVSVPTAEEKLSKLTQLSYPDLTAGEMYECTCFIVDSPVQLKCQLAQFQEDLEELMNKIASVAESAPVAINLSVGELCIAKYKEDECWYRGKIVCIGEEIVIEFIDYGNQDAVSSRDIRVMSEEFVVVPQACVTVNLADVHLTDINCNATKSWLEENFLEAEMRLKIVKVEMKTSVTAYVYEGSNSEHINDKIYELFATA